MKIIPFKAVRPTRDKVHLVASRSYVTYTTRQLREKLHHNPYSFLHIIHPDLGAKKLHKLENNSSRFELVRKKYLEFVAEGILRRDDKPCFYLYRQTKNYHAFTGLIAGVSLGDYLDGKIKVHEQTLSKRETIFTEYLEVTGINAEPVLLTHQHSPALEKIFSNYLSMPAEYDFTQTTRARHQLWPIENEKDIQAITSLFRNVSSFYIGDGHHRMASSVRLMKLQQKKSSPINDNVNHCMAFLLDENDVRIFEFNRLIKDLNGMSEKQFVERLSENFLVTEQKSEFKPMEKGEFSLYLPKRWFKLSVRKQKKNVIDSQLLTDLVLSPILSIHDLRTDKRIRFMEGPKGLTGLKHAVDRGKFAAAFCLAPITMEEMKRVADSGKFMPPKSTWIEPKLRSGMVVCELT
ncbi:MAG: DUF1015 domain-containing protein [Flavobacteriales bacterium]|nr:DUF1015 domain-containing protein [Flavobacteriales bacterium]